MGRSRRVVANPHPRLGIPTEPTYSGRLPGRPGEVNQEVLIRFLAALRAGNYRKVAAGVAGLSPGTVDQWIKRGRGQLTNQGRPPTEPYRRFARLVDEAEAAAEVQVTSNLFTLSRTNVRAAELWLRTRHPDRWPAMPLEAPAEPVEAQAPATPPRNLIILKPEQLPELVHNLLEERRLLARGGEPRPDRPPLESFYEDSARPES